MELGGFGVREVRALCCRDGVTSWQELKAAPADSGQKTESYGQRELNTASDPNDAGRGSSEPPISP